MKKLLLVAALMAVAAPASAQFSFRFERDESTDKQGKLANCEVYAKIAQVQAEANRKFNCGYGGGRWDANPRPHFRWCRFVPRRRLADELRERAQDLQRCFDRLGDFDDDKWDRR